MLSFKRVESMGIKQAYRCPHRTGQMAHTVYPTVSGGAFICLTNYRRMERMLIISIVVEGKNVMGNAICHVKGRMHGKTIDIETEVTGERDVFKAVQEMFKED